MTTPPALAPIRPFIEGREQDSQSDDRLDTCNPATGRKLFDIPAGCRADVDRAVRSARNCFAAGSWSKASPAARRNVLNRWADLIARAADQLDALDALEMGKPVSTPAFGARFAAGFVRFNAELVDKRGGELLPSDSLSTVLQARVPRGVVAAIVPWNFPTYNCVLKLAPALAAGNSVVMKPSELASQSALALARLAMEAGLPAGTLNVVPGSGEISGQALAEHTDVDMVTFTGSTAVGKLIMQAAGRSNMKVVSAECGGKSPQIVFDDGLDVDRIADHVAFMILLNQGQVCSAGSRLLVQDSLESVLLDKVIERCKAIEAGDPRLASTTFGPLVSRAALERVQSYIASAPAEGAELVYGGSRLLKESGGFFVEPAVFTNVSANSRLAREEIFGPVLSVLRFGDLDEAIQLANATCYGLAAYAWTARADVGFRLAHSLQTAATVVNAATVATEGPGFAFSGEPARLSGVGAECGVAGFESYRRSQTIWFNHG